MVRGLEQTSVEIPAEYVSYFKVAAKRCPNVLTPQSLAAQAYVESGFNPGAVSVAGAQGLMQFLPEVWRRYGTDADGDGVKNPFSPADSIASSAKYSCDLAKVVESIRGNKTELRLAAYNAGPGAVRKYKGIPPFPETQNYVESVQAYTDLFADRLASPATAKT